MAIQRPLTYFDLLLFVFRHHRRLTPPPDKGIGHDALLLLLLDHLHNSCLGLGDVGLSVSVVDVGDRLEPRVVRSPLIE